MKFLFFIFFSTTAVCQSAVWDFGVNQRLIFPGPAVSAGPLSTNEGVASVDYGGVHAISTNGMTVYDRTGGVIQNGTGLFGHFSTSQSATIINHKYTPDLFYLFTLNQTGNLPSLHYSVIDMSINAPNGAVSGFKNVPLGTAISFRENSTKIKHCNETDWWYICHQFASPNMCAYPVTETGVGIPVISPVGYVTTNDGVRAIGCCKFNPNGDMMAVCYYASNPQSASRVSVYSFDRTTGIFSQKITIAQTGAYGCEFSPNNKYLYISSNAGELRQYRIDTWASVQIANVGVWFGSLQIGPDGKIYCSRGDNNFLARINFPNEAGLGCGFQDNAITLTAVGRMGLPLYQPEIKPEPNIRRP